MLLVFLCVFSISVCMYVLVALVISKISFYLYRGLHTTCSEPHLVLHNLDRSHGDFEFEFMIYLSRVCFFREICMLGYVFARRDFH